MLKKLLLIFIVLYGTIIKAQPKWHLSKDKNNIQVYTANTGSSAFKNIKVVGVFDGTLEKLASIFLDVPKQKKWVYKTRSAYIINKVSNNELLYYVEIGLPLVSNRDIAIRMKINENKAKSVLNITTVGEPNAIPVTKGKVRVPKFRGDWKAEAIAKNKLKITYFLSVDPGGSLPSWIVNMFVSKGPYETFSKLGELLKE